MVSQEKQLDYLIIFLLHINFKLKNPPRIANALIMRWHIHGG